MLRHTTLCAVVVVIMAMGGTYAQTPDGACDGLEDNAWGLCNAYCYAMDCDGVPNASARACAQVALNFYRATDEQTMPCVESVVQTETQPGSCPCNFDLQFWTEPDQILPSSNLDICTGPEDPNTCLTCKISDISGSLTLLGILVDLFVPGLLPQEDKLFFFATEPSPLTGGACGADGSFASGFSYTTEGFELPVTSEEFAACAFDMGVLKDTYLAMCNNR